MLLQRGKGTMSELPKKQGNPISTQLNDLRTKRSNLDQLHIENNKRSKESI